MRFTKGFNVGGMSLSAYLDARNILNLKNTLAVFTNTNDITSGLEYERYLSADSIDLSGQASAAGVLKDDGSVDLTFGGAGANGCGSFVNGQGDPGIDGVQDCVYLVRAEQRFGNGDGVFTVDEQKASFTSVYNVNRGRNNFYGPGRRLRLGLELSF
jgi:hypothetical protein